MQKLQPFLYRFLSIALILNGTLLLINWVKNENPNKDQMIVWIAIANLVVGLAAFVTGIRNRRKLRQKEDDI